MCVCVNVHIHSGNKVLHPKITEGGDDAATKELATQARQPEFNPPDLQNKTDVEHCGVCLQYHLRTVVEAGESLRWPHTFITSSSSRLSKRSCLKNEVEEGGLG